MRKEKFLKLFSNEPKFRWNQIQQSFFDPSISGWDDISTIPQKMRKKIKQEIPWISVADETVIVNKNKDTIKTALKLTDNYQIETVLMENSKQEFTVCLSSQVGCAMNCLFCATGKMGFIRNLDEDEIIDQVRYWQGYIVKNQPEKRISNLVIMGMGEPMANYQNVKNAIKIILKYTDVGPTKITVSTVGIWPTLYDLLEDKEWPNVRLAISLHAAQPEIRKKIVPSTAPDFFISLTDWAKKYLAIFGNKKHHLSFEYIMINDLNDTETAAAALVKLAKKIGKVKINLIPYNQTPDSIYKHSRPDKIEKFADYLSHHGIDVTSRKSMGDDIAAACGQLITTDNDKCIVKK